MTKQNTVDVDAIVADAGHGFENDPGLRKMRQAEQVQYDKLMQAHKDQANGNITEAHHDHYLMTAEPAWKGLRNKREAAERSYVDAVMRPKLDPAARELRERWLSWLAEGRALNADLARIEDAFPSFVNEPRSSVSDFDGWSLNERVRIERALARIPGERPRVGWAQKIVTALNDYEPSIS